MTDPRLGDHLIGLELQLEELVLRLERARREGWAEKVQALELEIVALQLELADTAEQAAGERHRPVVMHGADIAETLIRRRKIA